VDGSGGAAETGRQEELGGGGHVELRHPALGARHQRGSIRRSVSHGVWNEDSSGRIEDHHWARDRPAYFQAD